MCYAFRRGSTVWRFHRESSSSSNILWKLLHSAPASSYGAASSTASDSIRRSNFSNASNNVVSPEAYFSNLHSCSIIQVPMMHICSITPNQPYTSIGDNYNPPDQCIVVKSVSTTNDLHISRGGADDFQFKFWVGVPICSTAVV